MRHVGGRRLRHGRRANGGGAQCSCWLDCRECGSRCYHDLCQTRQQCAVAPLQRGEHEAGGGGEAANRQTVEVRSELVVSCSCRTVQWQPRAVSVECAADPAFAAASSLCSFPPRSLPLSTSPRGGWSARTVRSPSGTIDHLHTPSAVSTAVAQRRFLRPCATHRASLGERNWLAGYRRHRADRQTTPAVADSVRAERADGIDVAVYSASFAADGSGQPWND